MRGTLKGKALVLSVCLPFFLQLRPIRVFPAQCVCNKEEKCGWPSQKVALGSWSPQLWLTGNPMPQLHPKTVPQASLFLLSQDPWLTFQT